MPAVMPPPAPTTGTVTPATPQPVSAPMPAPAAVAPSSAPIPTGVAPAMPAPSTPMAMATAAPTDDAGDAAVAVAEHHPEGEVFHPPALTHIEIGPPPNKFVQVWRKMGRAPCS